MGWWWSRSRPAPSVHERDDENRTPASLPFLAPDVRAAVVRGSDGAARHRSLRRGWGRGGDARLEGAYLAGHLRRDGGRLSGRSEQRDGGRERLLAPSDLQRR